MPTAATRSTLPVSTLHFALDLGNTTWKLAFATGHAHAPQMRTAPTRDLAQLAAEIAAAKARFGLPADAPVVSCHEVGRDGCWVYRALTALGVASHVADSASLFTLTRQRTRQVNRIKGLLALHGVTLPRLRWLPATPPTTRRPTPRSAWSSGSSRSRASAR